MLCFVHNVYSLSTNDLGSCETSGDTLLYGKTFWMLERVDRVVVFGIGDEHTVRDT